MKRLIGILFLTCFVLANTELGQIVRFPVLIHHYFEHTAENSNETFFQFIQDHYQNTIDHPDDKHGDHQRLPLKPTHLTSVHIPILLESHSLNIVFESLIIQEKTQAIFPSISSYVSKDMEGLWQPPKLV